MQLVYALGTPASLGPAAVAISAFDGVHLGHQRLVARVSELARQRDLRSVAVTFWPPRMAPRPDADDDGRLTTLERTLTLLASLGTLDAALVLPWTPDLAEQEPAAAVDLLSAWCAPQALVAGPAFALGQERGFTVERVEERWDGERVSSAHIRRLIRTGEVTAAARLLGRPHCLAGEVELGDQRGRLLGFPTANLRIDPRLVLPANGVYAVRVRLPAEAEATHAGVANIGVRPTFDGEPRLRVEVHLLDAAIDLYGLRLGVELIARLRDEQRFDGIEALRVQITRDRDEARALLAHHDTTAHAYDEQGR